MDYTAVIQIISIGAAAVFVLIALTNVISQVIKKIVNRENCPAQVVVFIIAEVLTFLAMAIMCSIAHWRIFWYYWPLAFIVVILVCYGAIFGYDNLYKQLSTAIKALINAIFKKEG